ACPEETTGEAVTQGIFFWNVTEGDNVVFRNCPYGYSNGENLDDSQSLLTGTASRSCRCNDNNCQRPYWGEPDISRCKYRVYNNSEITDALSILYQDIKKDGTSLINASIQLVSLTNDSQIFEKEDVALTALILENIVEGTNTLNETGTNIIKAVDNFINVDPVILFQSQETINSSTRVLSVVEDYLENVAINPEANVQQNERNIVVYSRDVNQSTFQGAGAESLIDTKRNEENDFTVYNNDFSVQPTVSQISLTMPKSLFENLSIDSEAQNQRIAFVIYQKSSLFQSQVNETTDGETVNKLNSLMKEYMRKLVACVFWDFSLKNGVGDWSQTGCTYKGMKDGIVTCHCSHLTNFAILMDVYIKDRIDDDHEKALSIISYIGCAISLGGLVLTIITILLFKELRTKAPTQILLNFCIALSLTLIVFIVAAERSKTSSTTWCRAAAIALHYFVLVVFMWMAIEAYNMYLCFVKILPTHHSHFMIKCLIVGWGLPAIIVIVTAVLEIKEYGGETYCRLQGLPFQAAFLGPVLLVLLINFIAFVLILRSLLTSGTKVTADRKTSGITQARRGIAILVVLGLTWLFGVLAIRDAKLVFQYLFCIFNSLQGLLVFIFYCVLSKDTRRKWKSLCSSKGKLDTSSGRYHHAGNSKFHEVTPSYNNTGSSSMTSSSNRAGFAANHAVSMEMQ
ncbi:adhesion G- coupled receptor G7-like, partial [Paramuricea clavata]